MVVVIQYLKLDTVRVFRESISISLNLRDTLLRSTCFIQIYESISLYDIIEVFIVLRQLDSRYFLTSLLPRVPRPHSPAIIAEEPPVCRSANTSNAGQTHAICDKKEQG